MWHFTYKCRLCGQTFQPSGCSVEAPVLDALIGAAKGSHDESNTQLNRVHYCKKSSDMGIADLIGAKFTPDK